MEETQPMGASLCSLSNLFFHLLKWWRHHVVCSQDDSEMVNISLYILQGSDCGEFVQVIRYTFIITEWAVGGKATKVQGAVLNQAWKHGSASRGSFSWHVGFGDIQWWSYFSCSRVELFYPQMGVMRSFVVRKDKILLPSREALRAEIEKKRTKAGKKGGHGTAVSEAEQRWAD